MRRLADSLAIFQQAPIDRQAEHMRPAKIVLHLRIGALINNTDSNQLTVLPGYAGRQVPVNHIKIFWLSKVRHELSYAAAIHMTGAYPMHAADVGGLVILHCATDWGDNQHILTYTVDDTYILKHRHFPNA